MARWNHERFQHARLNLTPMRHSLRPLHLGGQTNRQDSDAECAARRRTWVSSEKAKWRYTFSRHRPRRRAIQCAEASRLFTTVSGILDRPVKPGDDLGVSG